MSIARTSALRPGPETWTRRRWLLGALVVSTTGCARIEERGRTMSLESRARQYVKAVRWSSFHAAARFFRNRDESAVSVDADRLKNVRVTDSDHVVRAPNPEALQAEMTARFDYQLIDSATVKSVEQTVLWWYEPTLETWFIEGDFPAFQ